MMAVDGQTKQLRYLPDKQGNNDMEPGLTWRAHLAAGMLLCPMPNCGPFGRVVAAGDRRHHFAHPAGAGNHDHGTGPETLWHLSAKDVLFRWARAHPGLRDWTVHLDDTPVITTDGLRRPDVLAVGPGGAPQVAFEVQYSPLTGTEWKTRHDFYAAAGVLDIWLFAHHGPQWKPANVRQLRRRELALSHTQAVAAIQLSALHQKMLQDQVIPLWLDPTTQTVGTPTVRAWTAAGRGGYDLPPHQTLPACSIAADALEQCHVDLTSGALLTPTRLVQREEDTRLRADEQAARDREARDQVRRQAERVEATRRRREAERDKRRVIAARAAAARAEQDRRAEEDRQRKEAQRAASQAQQAMPWRQQYPPIFEHDPAPPPPAWWQLWRRRSAARRASATTSGHAR